MHHGPILLAALLFVAPAVAQPARNGNVWDGKAHQPAQGAVQQDQNAAGVAAPDEKVQQDNRDLDALGRKLTDKATNGH